MLEQFHRIALLGTEMLVILSALLLATLVLGLPLLYLYDRYQTRHTLRRNYPVIGRFRWFSEWLGEYLRQYFFAMDREELPFNRAQRRWVYRAAKGQDTTVPFGSTRSLSGTGTLLFVNCPYPTLKSDSVTPRLLTIGPDCAEPYTTASLFNISAMSYGALSKVAVQALARGAQAAGIWMNTGEGGLSPYHLEAGCDLVFQIGTAKYGVRNARGELDHDRLRALARYPQIRMFELKLSQGAKPGKGGILPGRKVTGEIAEIRGIPEGEDSISPNRHPEIRSNEDLLEQLQLIRDLTGKPTGFKAVFGDEQWIDELCKLIVARGPEWAPDFITIDGAEGGTGAAPQALIDYMGLPLRESLPLVVDTLCRYGLRERVKVIASGKLIDASEVALALAAGADFVNSARGFMFALGCVQALKCNKNSCPAGITTHDPHLMKGLVVEEKYLRVAHYAQNLVEQVGVIAHSCGVREPRELRRHHVRIIGSDGRSISLAERYPEIRSTLPQRARADAFE